jgi:hypothetical protein
VKEVSAHQDKVHLFLDGVSAENIDPCIEKVSRALGKLIPSAAKVHIRDMEEFHPIILPFNPLPDVSTPQARGFGEFKLPVAAHLITGSAAFGLC